MSINNDEKNFSNSGINPVDTASNKSDVYFSNVESDDNSSVATASPAVKKRPPKKQKIQSVKDTYIFFIVVIILSMLVSVYAVLCLNDILAITKTNSTVTVNIAETIEDTDAAVDMLSENGLIKCKNFCKMFANYRKRQVGGPYEPGVYYLTGKMGLEGMLVTLKGNSQTAETVTLTFPEGLTVPEMVDKLVEYEVCDKASILSVIDSADYNYPLVKDLTSSENIPYRLEGYLFPDTYDFFVGESANSVIKKFLSNGDGKITDKHKQRADELGYTMNDVIIIASIVQCEAGNEDQMKTIAGVLYNRLKDKANYPTLGCDSTSDYIKNKVAPSLSSTSAHTSDYYLKFYDTSNSSTFAGLPASPICNPGIAAINAALYPEDTNAYFFFHDSEGNMYTAQTNAEFREKVQTYAPYLMPNN